MNIRRYAFTIAAAALLAACGTAPTSDSTASGAPATASPHPVVTIKATGGYCIQGASCESTQVINSDGSYTLGGIAGESIGTIDPALAAAIETQIASADWTALQAEPFTGTCPIAYDGQEMIYTFHTAQGEQTLASCTVAIDETDPLFVAVAAAQAALAQP